MNSYLLETYNAIAGISPESFWQRAFAFGSRLLEEGFWNRGLLVLDGFWTEGFWNRAFGKGLFQGGQLHPNPKSPFP